MPEGQPLDAPVPAGISAGTNTRPGRARSFLRSEHILCIAEPGGGFLWHTGAGWSPASPEQVAHLRSADRVAPKLLFGEEREPRGREVSAGLRAFGEPFFVRRA